jgi:hypothetical protein
MYLSTVIAALENTGLVFRSFSDPQWNRLPGYSLAALQSTIIRDVKMLEGLAFRVGQARSSPRCHPYH